MESFYSVLSSAISAVPAHNFLLILGDFNGRLGKDTVPFSCHEECNRNGEYLHDLMEEHALLATNTQFQKAPERLWTWIFPPDINRVRHKQQIDFILARRKWRNSLFDSQAYNSMESVGSDHRVVSVKIRLSLRAKKKSVARRVRYNWRILENDVELQDRYEVFHLLSDDVNETRSSRYAHLMEANNEAAKETLTPIAKQRKVCLFSADPRVIEA